MNLMEMHKETTKNDDEMFKICNRVEKCVTIFFLRLENFNCQAEGSVSYKTLCLANILCGILCVL